MKDTLSKVIIGSLVVVSSTLTPFIPADMVWHSAYQYPASSPRTITEMVATTTQGVETMVEVTTVLPDADFTDDDGNGIISVAVFTDRKGNLVYTKIPDSQYGSMGQRNGTVYNPEKDEYISVLESFTPAVDAAVAYDTGNETNSFLNSGTSHTFSATASGANRAAILCIFSYGSGDNVSSVTFNGDTMPNLGKRAADAGGYTTFNGMAAPDAGTYNVVVNHTATIQGFYSWVPYTGVDQTTPFPNAAVTGSSNSTSFSPAITTTVDQSWIIACGRSPSRAPTAGANTVVRETNVTSGDAAWVLDSDGGRSTGSNAINWSYSPSQTSYYVVSAMAPAAAGGTPEATTTPRINVSGDVELGGDIIMQ